MYIDNIFASKNFKNEYNGSSESLQNEYKEAQNISTSAISMWMERWFLSSNAKDIGTLYLIFALFSGLIGTAFSVLIRLELSGPGVQYIADNQLYNSIITAHAIIMIFFMVEKGFNMLNMKLQPSLQRYMINDNNVVKIGYDNNNIVKIGSDINNNDNYKKPKHKYVKILVDNPFNNRDIILKVTKKQKGVYIWESLDDKHKYVGHSINLYNPSILNTKARRVLRYLNKHGFNDMKLTIYIMDENSTLEQVVELEQHFIDNLKPNLNVDLLASSSGYHEPMAQEIREKLRKQRGIPVYIYKADDFTLLYVFESKQYMFDSISIHHNTLNDCLISGTLYLDTLFFSLDLIEESTKTNKLTLDEIKTLVNDKRDVYNVKHPAVKAILAEFKDDSRKNLVFS